MAADDQSSARHTDDGYTAEHRYLLDEEGFLIEEEQTAQGPRRHAGAAEQTVEAPPQHTDGGQVVGTRGRSTGHAPARHRRVGPVRRHLGRRPVLVGVSAAAVLAAVGVGVARHDVTLRPASAPAAVSLADRTAGDRVSRDFARSAPVSASPSPSPSPSPTSASPSPSPSPSHTVKPSPTHTKTATPAKTTSAPIPSGCGSYSGNQLTACQLLPSFGFSTSQMPSLVKMWDKESGWNVHAENSSSGAYGIPQALPGDKMATVASDWRDNAATQIKWGLGYIKDRYGTPDDAWAFWQANGWY